MPAAIVATCLLVLVLGGAALLAWGMLAACSWIDSACDDYEAVPDV